MDPLVHWRQTPESSTIEKVGWLGPLGFIQFKRGALYLIAGVPRQRLVALTRAESPGRYFNNRIRGEFHTEQLT